LPLLSATPRNAKEQDMQLLMVLPDRDRFEGRVRDGVHAAVDESGIRGGQRLAPRICRPRFASGVGPTAEHGDLKNIRRCATAPDRQRKRG
jgi:hypothetical protein